MFPHWMCFFVDRDAAAAMRQIHCSPRQSGLLRNEIAPANQVVGCRAEAKQPIDESAAAVTQLAKERHRLQPSEGLLDQLPLPMTQSVTGVSRRPPVNRATAIDEFVLRDVRGNTHAAHSSDPGALV